MSGINSATSVSNNFIKSKTGFYDSSYLIDNAPTRKISEGRYAARFARTAEEIDAALALRFEVFNLELHEGLKASFINQRDEDEFDKTCHHLIVIERQTGQIVGTYHVRTLEMAHTAFGFYSANEFKIENLPYCVLEQSLETGRGCIAREHRNSRVLFLLWRDLAMYLREKRKRYFFGCCSLSSQNCADGIRALRRLVRDGFLHETFRAAPREDFACRIDHSPEEISSEDIDLPKLFNTYLRVGAKICGEPVIDRNFKTIDFLVIVDEKTMPEKYFKMFFG